MSEPLSPGPSNEKSDKPPRVRRRWYQFGLASLLGLVLLCGLLLAAWRAYLAPYRAQRETMALIERLKGSYKTQEALTWASRLGLAPTHNVTLVNLVNCQDPAEYFEAVARLPYLETLAVGGPAFGDQHLTRLQELSTLRWLVLDSTTVSDEGLESLKRANPDLQFHCAQCLSIAVFRKITLQIETQMGLAPPQLPKGAEPASFEYATRLHLGSIGITDADLAYVAALRNLDGLVLSLTKVSDRGLSNLVNLKELRWLSLAETRVTDDGLSYLASLKSLEGLGIQGTSITDAGVAHLAALKNLKTLFIHGSKVTRAGVANLRKALPDCYVE